MLDFLEQLLLDLLKGIEPHKYVFFAVEVEFFLLGDFTVEGTLVGKALVKKPLVEIIIDVAETAPQIEEFLS